MTFVFVLLTVNHAMCGFLFASNGFFSVDRTTLVPDPCQSVSAEMGSGLKKQNRYLAA